MSVQEVKTFKTNDLVLQVTKYYDPTQLDLGQWERFLDILCSDRQYQKEAIKRAVIYLASGKYNSIEELIRENWQNSKMTELKNRYKSLDNYIKHVQLPQKLYASIDLATGTGKSFVIYGIAQIMLGLGLIDKVVVFCPSITIKKGLTEKFEELSSSGKLKESLPIGVKYKNPRVIDSNRTIKNGDICIENIHKAYEKSNSSSSLRDSLEQSGQRVLVLNDEAHHIFNEISGKDEQSKSIKKWKEFLLDSHYNFKYVLGFTGTAYIKDEYFNDVIYRYSLRQAIDDKIVKMVDYVHRDDSIDRDERFQKILANHEENRNTYSKVKPLTILITQDIKKARQLTEALKEFLRKRIGITQEQADDKVLVVSSHKEHQVNVLKLRSVDEINDPTEWIVSVSMLTEGWDVKNVFQIVPWEDKAFNSKLLISQVLGRGLRIPEHYQSPQPRVRVFNHDAWSKNIKGLVDEILEIEMKLPRNVITASDRSRFNFVLHSIDYDKVKRERIAKNDHAEFDYTKGFVLLVAQSEESPSKETEYINLSGELKLINTKIVQDSYPIDEIIDKIYAELNDREWEGKILKLPHGNYTKDNLPAREDIEKIIRASMNRVGIKGDRLTEKNRQKILNMFSTLVRKKGKTIVNERIATKPYPISTSNIEQDTMSVSSLRYNSTVFYANDYEAVLAVDVKELLQIIIDDESLPKSSSKEINQYLFKTPLNMVFSRSEPERRFIEGICKKENAEVIDAWIKSRDQNFYSIEYCITTEGGRHPKQRNFNPDFFIKINKEFEYIVVVEVKSDDDDSDENKAKLNWAHKHFEDLNYELELEGIKQKYIFHFLSPNSYTEFFEYLRNGKLIRGEFRSLLEDLLESEEH